MSQGSQGFSAAPSSGMAVTSMVLGILAILTGCVGIGVLLGIVALILGIVALNRANREPGRYGGKGFAIAGIVMGAVGGVLMIPGIFLLIPSLGRAKELSNRAVCGANLRQITQAMTEYSMGNDGYPVLPYAPYGPGNSGTGTGMGQKTANGTVDEMYRTGALNGSPLAAQWVLVLNMSVPTKRYVCKSDSFANAPATTVDGVGNYGTNFQRDDQISYSFAYPYGYSAADRKMKVGSWWRGNMDVSCAVASDMAPLQGTGNPPRDVTTSSEPEASKLWNSGVHGGDGQNIVYADNHVMFEKRPDVGGGRDNIFTVSGTRGPGQYGGSQPVKKPISIPDNGSSPYDIYMVPARNLDTGGL